MPTVAAADSMATAYNEGVELVASVSGITDLNGINLAGLSWQWEQAASQNGSYETIAAGNSERFTPDQPQAGLWVRVCASFMDNHQTPQSEGPLCSTGGRVTAVNDAPSSADASVDIFTDINAGNPFFFTPAHFPFTDEESAAAGGITLVSVPAVGTMRNGQFAATAGTSVAAAAIPLLNYYPEAGAATQQGYASFLFRVSDGELSSDPPRLMTINIAPPGPTAARGMPSLSPGGSTFAEDAQITADLGGISDPNGVDEATLQWQWQQAAEPGSGTPADGDYTNIGGATMAAFTPDQPQVGMYIRVCASFRDLYVNPDSGQPAPSEEGPLCSAGRRVTNVDDLPTGLPRLVILDPADNSRISDPSPAHASEDEQVGVVTDGLADQDGGLPMAGGIYDLIWQRASDQAFTSDFEADRAYSPDVIWGNVSQGDIRVEQGDADAGFVRACISYVDSVTLVRTGGDFRNMQGRAAAGLCSAALAVRNVNDPATGAPSLSSPVREDFDLQTTLDTVMDEDGFDKDDMSSHEWQWYQADPDEDDPTMPGTFVAIDGFDHPHLHTSTPLGPPGDALVGKFLRACFTFEDGYGNGEGPLCVTTPTAVININDAPMARDNTVSVVVTASSTAPYTFSVADFSFDDADPDDSLASVELSSLPVDADGDPAGTLQVNGANATAGQSVTAVDIMAGHIKYWPATGQDVQSGYATFTFKVTDDGSEPNTNTRTTSADPATITIDLTNAAQTAATGSPTVAATDSMATAHNEDVQLTASTSGITEPNGIDDTSLQWSWQSAPIAEGPYADISGQTAATFTPLQAHVGLWIRVCVEFDDLHSTPQNEGPLCSATGQIANVNDAPTSDDAYVNVFTTAHSE